MKYYLIAGEASGDLHGSMLIEGLLAQDPEARIRFWGGDAMARACGQEPVRHYREGAVMGFGDVVAKAGTLLDNLSFCKKDIIEWVPDVVIPIDYPGFNLRIARFAHEYGIRVYWYIAPKTWASREKRNRQILKYVDRLFVIFPFETQYFEARGIPVTYLGNPLPDAVDAHTYERPCKEKYIALLPGSRKAEISRMMPVCMEIADRLDCNMLIAGAPGRSPEDYLPYIGIRGNVKLLFDRTYDILKFADAAIVNSGTASLEAALTRTPQVVCWSTGKITAWIGRHVLRVLDRIPFVSLGNLILGRQVFRELLQEDFTPAAVYAELSHIRENPFYRKAMLDGCDEIRRALGGSGASEKTASEIVRSLRDGAQSS